MITPRATRLVRVGDLQAFREAAIALALGGAPLDARDRLVVVPTRAAATHLLRSIEDTLEPAAGRVLPDLIRPDEIVMRLALRLGPDRPVIDEAEREVLLGVACRTAREGGAPPPFHLRPGLIAAILRFYDALRRNGKDVGTFERLASGALEPGASYDRGAERLLRQTRFLVAAFRDFEQRCAAVGADEHALRQQLLTTAAPRPYRHVVLTVTDRALDPSGLVPADWDLLARVPGLERLDVLVTDRMLAGAFHERIHAVLPGIEEVRYAAAEETPLPLLVIPPGDGRLHSARDREEEVGVFARRVKQMVRDGEVSSLDRVALVVRQPLPYVYVAREVLHSAGIPCQLFDALPLAAEPYAAAVDLVFSCVASNFARGAVVALLQSPYFRFETAPDVRLSLRDVAALDRTLSEGGYLGDPDALDRLVTAWGAQAPQAGRLAQALRAGLVLQQIVAGLRPLGESAPIALHLSRLHGFLVRHENLPGPDDPLRSRQLRARGAILGTLAALRDAYERFDPTPAAFDEVAALVRRWIEAQTFAPRTGDSGVHVVDAASAPFGRFEYVHLAGLVDGEWPDRPRRNIFYSASILRDLGWPAESDRLDGARAAFADLLRLPARRLVASTFLLEADALVSPSPFADELDLAALDCVERPVSELPIFDYEALASAAVDLDALRDAQRPWAAYRTSALTRDEDRYRGQTAAHVPAAYSLSALERYQDCPFKFFAADVLRLEEAPEDEDGLSPRARGRFIHEVFQRFFEAWDARAAGAITPERVDEARSLFADVAEPLLGRLPEADAALERTRLFGSAISVGIVDVVLGLEAARPAEVSERWLEYRLEGEFSLGEPDRRVSLRGVADRIDLLDGRRLRVVDYKTGSAPDRRRALQVPIYALCAAERLNARDGRPWAVEDAAYIAFSGRKTLVPVVKAGAADGAEILASARTRLFEVVDGVTRGEFPPRPHDEMICRYCAYAAVCRKDYVGDL